MATHSNLGNDGGADEVRRFLDDALCAHLIDERTHLRLVAALKQRRAAPQSAEPTATVEAMAAGAVVIPPPPSRLPVRPLPPPPSSLPVRPVPPPPRTRVPHAVRPSAHPAWWREPEPAPERAAWAAWLGRVRELVFSDLALHGLAYLGVLLVFVATFGFVVFAFGELDRSLRPVAEAAIPLICFAGAWFLRRQRAPHVAIGLELLAGLTLPLVTYASFVDGGPVPPDLTGNALIVVLALVSLAIGTAYAAWTIRRPASSVRFLVPLMAWMAVWAVGLWFAAEPIAGSAIRRPNPWQMTGFTLAVVVSLGFATAFPRVRFAAETKWVALPGLALGYALLLATGFQEGWPAGPVAITGVATVIGIDLLAAGAPERQATGARLAQSLVLAFTAASLLPQLEPGWSGVALTVASIALLERWARARAGTLERTFVVAELGVGLAMSTSEPWAMVVAFGAASIWVHVRRIVGLEALGVPARGTLQDLTVADTLSVLLPAGIGVGLWRALGPEEGLFTSAVVLAAAAICYRIAGTDRVITAWLLVTSAAVDVSVGTCWAFDGTSPTLLAVAILAAAILLTVSPKGVPRMWLGAAGLAWAGIVGMDVAGLDVRTQATIGAGVGLGIVLAGALLPTAAGTADTTGRALTARLALPAALTLHLEAVGQVVSGGSLAAVAMTPGPSRLACLGAWTLGWVVVIVRNEIGKRPETKLGQASVTVAPALALVSLPTLALDAARAAGLLERHPALAGVVLCAPALMEAAATRAIAGRRPLALILAWGSAALGVIAIAAASAERWPLIVACSALIGIVLLIPKTLRAEPMVWGAWAASAALAVLLAERAGVPTRLLYAAGFAWSAVALLGGLLLDRRLAGPRSERTWVRTSWLVPPAVLGSLGLPVSLALTLGELPSVYGWWMLGGAAVALAVALLLRAAWISGIAWALAAFGAASLTRDLVFRDPWILVSGAAVALGASWALGPSRAQEGAGGSDHPAWSRWDLPPFILAHVLVVLGCSRAVLIDEIAPTWLTAAGLSFAAAAIRRDWQWAVGGAVLAVIGARDLGTGPFAIVLGAESLAAGLAASRAEGEARLSMQFVCAALAAAAWAQGTEAIGLSVAQTLRATAVASGALTLAAAGAVRLRKLTPDWLRPAALLGVGGVLITEAATSRTGAQLYGDPSARFVLAAALAMAAAAAAMSAAPSGWPRLRELSSVVAVGALGELLLGLDISAANAVAVLVTLSVFSLAISLALWRTGKWRAWAPAIGIVSALTAVASLPIAATQWPHRGSLVAALLACGVEAGAIGLVLRRTELLVAAPVLLSAAWLTFASEVLAGNPQWFTVPIGLTAIAVVEVVRWDLRRRGRPFRTPEIVAFETAGVAFLVGASPIQLLQGSPWAGVIGAVLGVAVAAWGALTRVRRRLWFGVGVAVGCLLLLVLVPLARELPRVASAAPWVVLGAIGVTVVAIATALERGRARLLTALRHMGELFDGWE